jgi:hypothetical protein
VPEKPKTHGQLLVKMSLQSTDYLFFELKQLAAVRSPLSFDMLFTPVTLKAEFDSLDVISSHVPCKSRCTVRYQLLPPLFIGSRVLLRYLANWGPASNLDQYDSKAIIVELRLILDRFGGKLDVGSPLRWAS